MSAFRFSKIVVLESLKDGEKKTGKLISDDLVYMAMPLDIDIPIEYLEFGTKQELNNIFKELSKNADAYNDYPILHIEAHGSDDKKSLSLKSGEYIDWFDLEESLRVLNFSTKGNLLVVMATCFGAYVNSVISIIDRAPFWGVIGPENSIYPDDVYAGLMTFYKSIFSGNFGDDLCKNVNSTEFKIITAEWFFVKAYKYYVDKYCDSSVLNKRAENLFKMNKAQGSNSFLNIEQIKNYLNLEGKEKFDALLNHFFMVDLYPENANKISVTYEKIKL